MKRRKERKKERRRKGRDTRIHTGNKKKRKDF